MVGRYLSFYYKKRVRMVSFFTLICYNDKKWVIMRKIRIHNENK